MKAVFILARENIVHDGLKILVVKLVTGGGGITGGRAIRWDIGTWVNIKAIAETTIFSPIH